jgi:hypothetical protein
VPVQNLLVQTEIGHPCSFALRCLMKTSAQHQRQDMDVSMNTFAAGSFYAQLECITPGHTGIVGVAENATVPAQRGQLVIGETSARVVFFFDYKGQAKGRIHFRIRAALKGNWRGATLGVCGDGSLSLNTPEYEADDWGIVPLNAWGTGSKLEFSLQTRQGRQVGLHSERRLALGAEPVGVFRPTLRRG